MSNDRYTELIDSAQEQQQKTNQALLDRHMARMKADNTHPDFDGKHCVDGGELIPKARLALGKIRCVACQETRERKQQTHRR